MRQMNAKVLVVTAAIALATGLGRPVWAGQAEIDAQIKLLTGDNADARQAARAALTAMGAEAVKPLLQAVGHSNRSVGKAAEMALADMATRAGRFGGEHERLPVSKAMAAELSNASLPQQTRAYACRMLNYIGREEAIPALVMALSAKDIADNARMALTANPTPAALDALQEALPKADTALRVGLINSLGMKAQRRSIPLLAAEVKNSDETVGIAAMEALSKIADPSVIDLLRSELETGSPKKRRAAHESWLRLGETLVDNQRPLAAAAVYKEALKWNTTVQDRCAALVGLARTDLPETIPVLLDALRTTDQRDVRGAIIQGLEGMKSPEVSKAITSMLAGKAGKSKLSAILPTKGKALSPAVQMALLRVLIARKEVVDPAGVVAVLKSGDESSRIAALECLAQIGDESVAPDLLGSLSKPEGAERKAAAYVLSRLRATNGLKWLQQIVVKDSTPSTLRAVLVDCVGERRDPGSVALLSEVLKKDQDEAVRVATFQALGKIGQNDALPLLLAGVNKDSGKDRNAADAALNKLPPDATAPMIAAVANATPLQKAALLKALGFRKDDRIKSMLLEAYKSDDKTIKDGAVEGLRRLADPATLAVLEEAAGKGVAVNAAVAGMLRIAEKMEAKDPKGAIRTYQASLKLAKQSREQQAALKKLAEHADLSSFDLVRSFLDKGEVRTPAAEAVLAVAPSLPDDRKADGIAAVRAAIAIVPSSGRARGAMEKLIKWGVDIDLAAEAGFITNWWLVGPFPNPDKKMFDGKFFPEDGVDLAAKTKVGDKEYAWKKYRIVSADGAIDLRQAVADSDNVGCYMYAEVTSDEARDVLFKMGSDDDIVCWLNGKKIHANKVDRGMSVDADVVKARLEKGVNRILLKVLNGGAQWAACLRITDAQDKALKLTQRKE